MATESLTDVIFHHWLITLILIFVSYLLKNRFSRGLNKYPGPFIASLTDWWRFWDVYGRRPEVTHIKLHAQHGDVVRLGPNTLSFADPKALKTIYGLNKGFIKVRTHIMHNSLRKYRQIPCSLNSIPSNNLWLRDKDCPACSALYPSDFTLN